jgi:hypothetical protein
MVPSTVHSVGFPIRSTRLSDSPPIGNDFAAISGEIASLYHHDGERYALIEIAHQHVTAPVPSASTPTVGETVHLAIPVKDLRQFAAPL